MYSAFGVEHGEGFSKRAPSLKALLSPYKGGVPRNAKRTPSLENRLAPYKGAVPKSKGIDQLNPANRPLTMKLRSARRNAAFGRQPKPGEAMR